MSIQFPSQLNWLVELTAGQSWPKGDEDKLRELGRAWEQFSEQVNAISGEFEPYFNQVTANLSGQPAREFARFVTLMHQQLPGLVQAGKQVTELSNKSAQELEYSKYMIIAQMILLAAEIAWCTANAIETFGATEALIPGLVAASRLTVQMILRRLLMAVLREIVMQVGLDVAVQTIMAIKAKINGESFSWNWGDTLSAVENGAIGGGIGGITHLGLNKFNTHGFGDTFKGGVINAAITGLGSTLIGNFAMGGDADLGLAEASSVIGAIGGGHRGHGGGHEPQLGPIDVENIKAPKFDDLGGKGDGGLNKFHIGDDNLLGGENKPTSVDAPPPYRPGSGEGGAGPRRGGNDLPPPAPHQDEVPLPVVNNEQPSGGAGRGTSPPARSGSGGAGSGGAQPPRGEGQPPRSEGGSGDDRPIRTATEGPTDHPGQQGSPVRQPPSQHEPTGQREDPQQRPSQQEPAQSHSGQQQHTPPPTRQQPTEHPGTQTTDKPLVAADVPAQHRPPGAPSSMVESDLNGPHGPETEDLGNLHPAFRQPLNHNPELPGFVFHGSSEPPEVIFNQGLKSSATITNATPHYDIPTHVHNAKGSGFVSTTGDHNVALQFVRADPFKTVTDGGTTFQHRDGWIYAITPSDDMIHLPSQDLSGDMKARYGYQDEWAKVDHVPPTQIEAATHVEGYYNVRPGPDGQLMVDVPKGGEHNVSMRSQQNPSSDPARHRPPGAPDEHTDTPPVRTHTEAPATEGKWNERRDLAPVTSVRTERFEPTYRGATGDGILDGWKSRIGFDSRRIEVEPGTWVRELTVQYKTVAGHGVSDAEVHALQQKLSDAVRDNVNGKYHFDNGDQLHVRVEFNGSNPHGQVTVQHGRQTDQATWSSHASGKTLLHEMLHNLGLRDSYSDQNSVFRSGAGDHSHDMMGEHSHADITLSDDHLRAIDHVMSSEVQYDLPFGSDGHGVGGTREPRPTDEHFWGDKFWTGDTHRPSEAPSSSRDITDTSSHSSRSSTDSTHSDESSDSAHSQDITSVDPAHRQPLATNPPMPPYVYHGSSEHPDTIFRTGLKSSADMSGNIFPHYDIPKHIHNARGSGFVSTTGDYQVAMQFVRANPGDTIRSGNRTFQFRDGWIYTIAPSRDMIHLPSQHLPENLRRFGYQDEWAQPDRIQPEQIVQAHHIRGYYDVVRGPDGNVRVEVPPGHGVSTVEGRVGPGAPASQHRPPGAPSTMTESDAHGHGSQSHPAGHDEPTPPRAVDRAQLPSYLRENQSLGLGRALEAEGAADTVVSSVHHQLPMSQDERRTATGLDDIHHAVTQDLGSLLGDGRRFEVLVGDRVYEAKVRAALDFDGVARTEDTERGLDSSGSTAVSSSASTSKTRGHDISSSVTIAAGTGPGGTVSGRILSAKPTVTLESGSGVTLSHSLSHKGSDIVNAKATFHVSLVDKQGQPTHPAGSVRVQHDVKLALPTDAAGTPPAHAGAKDVHPDRLTVFGTESVSGVGRAFDEVSGDLHHRVTEIGSPGRRELLNFLSANNIRDNLPAMAKGWIYSPDLVSADGTRVGAVRMRIEPTGALLEGSAEGYQVGANTEGSASPGRSATTKSGFDVSGTFGGVAALNPVSHVSAGGGLTVGYSNRDSMGTSLGDAAKWKSTVNTEGVTGLYKMGFKLHVQAVGHDTHTVNNAAAHVRMSGIEAHHAGLRTPDGATGSFEQTPRRHYAPSYLESGKALGLSKVFHLSGTDDIREHVENTLRGNETLRNLAPEFGSGRLNGASRSDTAQAMANRRALDAQLSHDNLASNMDSMLGKGFKFRLKQPGLTQNHYVTVTVKAHLDGLEHLGKAPDHSVRGGGSTKTKLGISGVHQWGVSASLDGRVNSPVTHKHAVTTPTTSFGVRYGYQRTWRTDAGPEAGDKLSTSGEKTAHVFKSNVRYEVTIEEHSRDRSWVRRITPAMPGNHVPEVRGGQAHQVRGEVTVLVPESLVGTNRPDAVVDNHTTTPDQHPPSINNLLSDANRHTQPDFQRVEAIVGAEHIHSAAVDALREAGGGDESLALQGSVTADELHHTFSPEVMLGDPQLLSHGTLVDGLQYNRRIADRVGAVGMTMKLSEPKLVSTSDDISLTRNQTGGYTTSGGRQDQHSVDLNVGQAVAARPNETHPHGSGTFTASSTLRGWTWTSKGNASLGGSVEHGVSSQQGRTVLLKMNAEVHVVAESRQTNLLHNTEVRTAGRTVQLPDSVFVRVTEQRARDMGVLPTHDFSNGNVAQHDLPVPPTLSAARPSIGFGHVEPTGDLSGLVPSLRHSLGDLGGKLLPDSVLDDSMGNLRRIGTQSSQEGVRALVDSALNGGVSLIAPHAKTFGHTSYEVVLHATPNGAPTYLGVKHDGSSLSHDATSSSDHAVTKGKESSSSVSGRFTGTGMPKTEDSSVSASVPDAVAASISRTTGHKITTMDSTGHTQSSSSGGPQARYRMPVNFHLEIKHDGVVIGRSTSDAHNLLVRKLADDVSTVHNRPSGGAPTIRPVGGGDLRPDQIKHWRDAGEQLPEQVHVDDFTGSVDDIRQRARTLAGTLKAAPDHALTTTLTPEVIKANLPAMLKGPVDLPGLRDAGMTAFARLTNPHLASVSDSVDISGSRSDSSKVDTEISRSVTGSVDAIPAGGGDPASSHREHPRDVGASAGGFDVKRSGLNNSETYSSGGPRHPAPSGSTSTKGRSKVVVYDTEIRLVKDGRGISLRFKDSSRVRLYDDGSLPDGVTHAQDKVRDAEKTWQDAEQEFVKAQHAVDDAHLAARDELAQRRTELGQHAQREAAHLNRATALRDQAWRAYGSGDHTEITRVERELLRAHDNGEQLTRERARIERQIRDLEHPAPRAEQAARQAYQRARDAENAWWRARQERDQAVADLAKETRPAPAHHDQLPDDGHDYDPARHDPSKSIVDDESWRHSNERTAPWFEPDRPLRPERWEHLRRDDLSRRVHTEIADVKTSSRIRAGRPELESYTGIVRYDLRRIEVEPGRFVQEHTVKLHLTGDAEQVANAKRDAAGAVDDLLNKGYRLPSGDQFHLRVEFTDSAADAHSTVRVGEHATDQDHWAVGEHPHVLAHEVLHYLGPGDEYRDTGRVFQKGVKADDGGLLGGRVGHDDVALKPRNLWYVERVSHDQVAVPDTRLGHDRGGVDLARPNPRATVETSGPTRPSEHSSSEDEDSGSENGMDVEPDWVVNPQPAPHAPPAWEIDARRGPARAIGTALSGHDGATEVFRQLHLNGRDPESVRALEHAFLAEHGTTLADALDRSRLNHAQVEQALELLGHRQTMFANPDDDVRVAATADPSTHDSTRDLAMALRQRMELGQHEETLALLGGVNRDVRAAWAVHDTYHAVFGTMLTDDLNARMPAEHGAYLNHLLGDVGGGAIPHHVADHWYRELERATFQHEVFGELPIPTGHPEDGCYLRAHMWALRLHQLGGDVRKIFVARAHPLLSIQSATAAGATRDHPVEVNWGYHVAPVVWGRDEHGVEGWRVFDPAMRAGVMSAAEWISRTGAPEASHPLMGSLPEIHDLLRQNSDDHPDLWTAPGTQRLPMGAVSVITDVHAYGFPHPGNGMPVSIRDTDQLVRGNDDTMMTHSLADMDRQLRRGVQDVLDRGVVGGQVLDELHRLTEGNLMTLGFLARPENADLVTGLMFAVPFDRMAELDMIFPSPHMPVPDPVLDATAFGDPLAGLHLPAEAVHMVTTDAHTLVGDTLATEGPRSAQRLARAMPMALRQLIDFGVFDQFTGPGVDPVTAGLSVSHMVQQVGQTIAEQGTGAGEAVARGFLRDQH
jgi:Glutaminase